MGVHSEMSVIESDLKWMQSLNILNERIVHTVNYWFIAEFMFCFLGKIWLLFSHGNVIYLFRKIFFIPAQTSLFDSSINDIVNHSVVESRIKFYRTIKDKKI